MVSLSHWGGFFCLQKLTVDFNEAHRSLWIWPDVDQVNNFMLLYIYLGVSKHVLNAIFFFCYTFLSSKWYLQSVKEMSLLSQFLLSAGSGLTYQSSMSTLHFSEIQGQEHFTLHHHLDTHAHTHWAEGSTGSLTLLAFSCLVASFQRSALKRQDETRSLTGKAEVVLSCPASCSFSCSSCSRPWTWSLWKHQTAVWFLTKKFSVPSNE